VLPRRIRRIPMKNTMVFLTCVLVLAGCGQSRMKSNAVKKVPPAGVKVMEVRMTGSASSRTYVGTVHPVKSNVLSSPYSGTLIEIKVRQGQTVKKGETVAVVESQRVKSSLDMAWASLQQARDGYRRAKSVHESGSIADVKMVEVETQLRQAEAAYEAAGKAYSDCTIKAPYSGTIGDVYTDVGVELSAVEPIVKILDISSVEIRIPVPENEIGALHVGSEASFSVPALGIVDRPAVLASKGITASALSHSYECVLSPRSPVDGLMPGMVCKVTLTGGPDAAAAVPSSVIKTDVSGRYVWAVKNGAAVKLPVSTGGFSGDGVIVTEGLSEGDTIIVEGARKVSSGMKVKIIE